MSLEFLAMEQPGVFATLNCPKKKRRKRPSSQKAEEVGLKTRF